MRLKIYVQDELKIDLTCTENCEKCTIRFACLTVPEYKTLDLTEDQFNKFVDNLYDAKGKKSQSRMDSIMRTQRGTQREL